MVSVSSARWRSVLDKRCLPEKSLWRMKKRNGPDLLFSSCYCILLTIHFRRHRPESSLLFYFILNFYFFPVGNWKERFVQIPGRFHPINRSRQLFCRLIDLVIFFQLWCLLLLNLNDDFHLFIDSSTYHINLRDISLI